MNDIPAADAVDVLDVEKIVGMIPHRYPMLLVDRVFDLIEDDSATGLKNVTINEPFFQGHFPSRPVMPGVLIVEAMAQTAAVLVVKTLGDAGLNKLVYFMTIENAKFRKPVVPGDTLLIKVKKTRGRGNVYKFDAVAEVNGKAVADASFGAMIVDQEK